jgi:hypothetical protein
MPRPLLLAALLAPLAATAARAQDGRTAIRVEPAGSATVAGVVVDDATGEPLPAASVRVPAARASAVTDARGRFVLPRLAPGTYGAMVSRLGYAPRAEIWTVDAGGAERQVRLHPDAVQLAALRVEVRRLERRLRATGWSARAWGHDALATSAEPNAELFVRDAAGVTPVPCGMLSTGGSRECMRVRGTPMRPCVILDETPSSFGELSMYRPAELYRVEIYRGGAAVVVYSTPFAERLMRSRWTLAPVEVLVQQFCLSH